MSATKRLNSAALALLIGATITLAGCSSSNNTGPNTTPVVTPIVTPVTTPSVTPTVPMGTPVTVSETEFAITLSQTTFTPGTYTFEVTDAGTMTHTLNIKGPGITDDATSNLSPGGTASLTVTLQAGTYELWCSIGSHKANGMDMTITVA